jgi:biotin carboxyl carrier protein
VYELNLFFAISFSSFDRSSHISNLESTMNIFSVLDTSDAEDEGNQPKVTKKTTAKEAPKESDAKKQPAAKNANANANAKPQAANAKPQAANAKPQSAQNKPRGTFYSLFVL